MANVLTLTPYKIDTASATSFKNQGGLPTNQPFWVSEVYWFNPVTPGDTFVMTDTSGAVIRTGRCEVANQSQVFQFVPPRLLADFTVATLASGTLYIRG
jgi:hypothetical protein